MFLYFWVASYHYTVNTGINLREFACLTTVILAPLRMEWGLHAGSATSLPLVPRMPLASYRSMVFFEV